MGECRTRGGTICVARRAYTIVELTPAAVLAMWAAGLCAGAAVVVAWRIVGPGYTWLAATVSLLFGVPAALAADGSWAWLGTALVVAAVALTPRPRAAALALGLAVVPFLVTASLEGTGLGALTGALLLGGVTSEMMLGHWYLIDPRLPRWALRLLAAAGLVGVVVDAVAMVVLGAIPWDGADLVVGVGFLLLTGTTAVLLAAVRSSLGEQGYSGVMSATGLSYLATLTAVGAAVVGRLLVDGPVLS